MFILRTITGDGHELNRVLGDSYNIDYKEKHPESFKGDTPFAEWDKLHPDELYGCITYNRGSEIIPLWKKQQNYIMTETGKTFANISYK